MESYCITCNKLTGVRVETRQETYKVKGEPITITAKVAMCPECNSVLSDSILDDQKLTRAFDIYRQNHGLLSREEIIGVREMYGISQRAMAKLLDWGEVTIHRYENGALPDASHNRMLALIKKPENMKDIFLDNGHKLPESARKKLAGRLGDIAARKDPVEDESFVIQELLEKHSRLDEYSGFTGFNLDKCIAMICYMAEKAGGVFTTKLNKLLWYADFLYFKKYSNSISGSTYYHLPLGPVPDDFKLILSAAEESGMVCEEEVVFPNGYSGTRYKSLQKCDYTVFTSDEDIVMQFVVDYFKNFSGEAIKDRSHNEKAYLETGENEMISYKFARDLSVSV